MRSWASAAPSTIQGCVSRNATATSGTSSVNMPSRPAARSATPARVWTASSPEWNGIGLEEAAGRGVGGRGGSLHAGAGEDLQADPVGVLEEDPAAGRALAVRDDPVVVELETRVAHARLGRLDGGDGVDLEGQVVQARTVGGER